MLGKNMRVLALDLGDVWIGMALSDPLGMFASPYKTIKIDELENTLRSLLGEGEIDTVVIGCPLTMKGAQSEQTKKILAQKEQLAKRYDVVHGHAITWVLWDERLSSKRAQQLQKKKVPSVEEKRLEHARAAAFILQSYLDARSFNHEKHVV